MTELTAILGKKVAIVGLGKSGQAAKSLIELQFPNLDLITFDDSSKDADTLNPDEIVKFNPTSLIVSPGYPLNTPWLQKIISAGVSFLNEVDLASFYLTTEKSIGITGSIGKSTTAAMIFQGAQVMDPNAFLGANFGTPLCEYIVDVLKNQRPRAEWLVLELSSYHLETLKHLTLDLGIITYLAPNHLERYPSVDSYYETKWKIADRTKGQVLLNMHSDDIAKEFPKRAHGKSSLLGLHLNAGNHLAHVTSSAQIIGEHNKQNILVSIRTAEILGWSEEAKKKILSFKGLPHRLENIGHHQGILFINDSKSTSMESVLQAVDSVKNLTQGGKLILLLGGKDKNLPWENLHLLANENIEFVFFGECGPKAQAASRLSGKLFPTFKETLSQLSSIVKKGDVCLLSPGGTSWDEFKNFEERGNFFKNFVTKNF